MPPALPRSEPLALVADVGGTNTRVALARGTRLVSETVRRYRNTEHSGLPAVIAAFRETEALEACDAACVAIAGPVRDGRGTLTNLDWSIDEASLAAAAGAGIAAVLNDLQAQGHALGHIAAANLRRVVDGAEPQPGAAQLVIGVGTGFNVAPVHWAGDQRLVVAAEAGHETLPIRNEADFRLARFVEKAHGFAAVEDVLSGRGLARIFAWLGSEAGDPREADAAEIMRLCAEGGDARAAETVATAVRLLGCVAGDAALGHLPFGGIFLAGGVARALAPHFDDNGFARAFRDKGRFGEFLNAFSIDVIEDDFAALTGCASCLAQDARSGRRHVAQ